MDEQLKGLLLAVLHNNEIIMNQTEDLNKKNKDSNQALNNMRKIYDGVREKIENHAQDLTQADLKFLVIAINLTMTSLTRQLHSIEVTIDIYKKLQGILGKAAETPEDLANLLEASNVLDIPEEKEETTNSEEKM